MTLRWPHLSTRLLLSTILSAPILPTLLLPALLLPTLVLTGCKQAQTDSGAQIADHYGEAMIAAAEPRAVEAGLDILAKGGSAIDAAIAVQTVLGLVEPESSGIGGGAFLIYYDAADGSVSMYDGRETAPSGAGPDLFLDENGARLSFVNGMASGRSTGVPGVIAMLHMAHSEHGKLAWREGFSAAIAMARDGFRVSEKLSSSLRRAARFGRLARQEAARDYFFIDPAGKTPLQIGYNRVNTAYADSLSAIAKDWRAMYEGDIPKAIIAAVQEEPLPGSLSEADFANYQPRKREALCSPYRSYKICGPQPPSSGGVAVQAIMRQLETFDMSSYGPDDAQGWHYFIESSRLAYADRDQYVADDSFVDVPITQMLDRDYLDSRAALIMEGHAMPVASAGDPAGFARGQDATADSPGTSHFTIVDGQGNALSMTTTVESGFGSQRMAAGFILNNQLTDFSFLAVDEAGLPIANAPAPGKRPRSSMAPTLIFDSGGEFILSTGSPGGNSIIAYTAKTVMAMLDWGLTPQEAAELPNVIARGDSVKVEHKLMADGVVSALETMGHELQLSDGESSGIHIIKKDASGSGYIGGADPRRAGIALSLSDFKNE